MIKNLENGLSVKQVYKEYGSFWYTGIVHCQIRWCAWFKVQYCIIAHSFLMHLLILTTTDLVSWSMDNQQHLIDVLPLSPIKLPTSPFSPANFSISIRIFAFYLAHCIRLLHFMSYIISCYTISWLFVEDSWPFRLTSSTDDWIQSSFITPPTSMLMSFECLHLCLKLFVYIQLTYTKKTYKGHSIFSICFLK